MFVFPLAILSVRYGRNSCKVNAIEMRTLRSVVTLKGRMRNSIEEVKHDVVTRIDKLRLFEKIMDMTRLTAC